MIDMTYDENVSKLRSEAWQETQMELQQIIRQQSELLARMVHELRNPIAPITHAVKLMEMLGLNEDAEELRRMIVRQVDQLNRVIDGAMDVSRLTRGKIQLQKEEVELAKIIQTAASDCSATMVEREQSLQIKCPCGTTLVKADPRRLTQALSQLLQNSSKFSARGSVIELSASVHDTDAVIRIRDNGIGISAEQMPYLFQLFPEDIAKSKRSSTGLGVGLFMTKAIIELHDGSICAESEGVGCGSMFSIRLPSTTSLVMDGEGIENSCFASERKFRILIVDDQRAMRFVLTQLLEKMGHEVESVESAFKALLRVNTFEPDIVFSDISMPDMNGYDLATALRKRVDTKHALLVAITGSDEDSEKEHALQSGFDEHLTKPVDADHLRELIARRSSFNLRS